MDTLSTKIQHCLTRHSPAIAQQWAQNAPQDSLSNVNRYLRVQLGLLPVNTTEARECLLDDITEKDWLRHFRKYVAPVVAQCQGLSAWK